MNGNGIIKEENTEDKDEDADADEVGSDRYRVTVDERNIDMAIISDHYWPSVPLLDEPLQLHPKVQVSLVLGCTLGIWLLLYTVVVLFHVE
mgnify:CR=1 FL=1